MIRRAIKDSSLYIASTLLTRGINILLIPFYTKVLTPADYGNVDLLYTVAAIVNLVLALEVTQAVARFLPDLNDLEVRTQYISSAHWFTIAVYLFFGVFMIGFHEFLRPVILSPDTELTTYFFGIISIVIQGPFNYLTNLLKWTLRAKLNALINFVTSIVIIICSLYLVLHLSWGITGIFIGNFLGNLVGTILSWAMMRSELIFQFRWAKLKELLEYSSPLVLSSAAIFISLYIDRILLKFFHDAETVGLYGIAFRFASIVHLFLFGLQSGITPLILNHYTDVDTPAKIEQLFRYYLLLMCIVTLGMAMFSREILILFTRPEYYDAAPVMPLLTLALFLSNAYFLAPGLSIGKKTKTIALISFSSALVNLALNAILIPTFSIIGAATATVVSGGLVMMLYFWFNQKYFPLPLRFVRYLGFFGFMLLASISVSWIYLESPVLLINVQVAFFKVLILIGCSVGAFLFLFSLRESRELFARLF